MKYWTEQIIPSIQLLSFTPEALAAVTCAVLTIHGTKDRSAPYGAGQDWASLLPNARLMTVDDAGHGPWVEAPEAVFATIGEFLATIESK
jgi:pimeloyl-ACP methyl ester carboxylesterase